MEKEIEIWHMEEKNMTGHWLRWEGYSRIERNGGNGLYEVTWEDGIQGIAQKHGRTLVEMGRLCEDRTEWQKCIVRGYMGRWDSRDSTKTWQGIG